MEPTQYNTSKPSSCDTVGINQPQCQQPAVSQTLIWNYRRHQATSHRSMYLIKLICATDKKMFTIIIRLKKLSKSTDTPRNTKLKQLN